MDRAIDKREHSPGETVWFGAPCVEILLVIVFVFAATSGSDAVELERENSDLLAQLVGAWRGKAVRTPIGPHPYDIEFSRQTDGAVKGVADTGGSDHHWTFMHRNGKLRVRFLTTFRGNTQPIWLNLESRVNNTFSFRAEQPAHLRVDVSPMPNKILIDIFLHEMPHVDIELTRKP